MTRDMTTLNPLAAKLLAAIYREVADWLETDLYALPNDRHEAGRIRLAVRDASEGILRMNLDSWLGRVPTEAERRAAHRALDQLTDAGYLVRLTGPTGRTVAVQVIDDEVKPRL